MIHHGDITNDAWLLLRNSDENALLTLYNKHYLGLINFGIKITGDRVFTNDCINQLLIELWDKRDKLPAVENVRSYLLTCLKNKIISEIKNSRVRDARLHSMEAYLAGNEMPYEEYLIQSQTDQALRKKLSNALARLTYRQRELLKMKFFEDCSYDEIAQKCGITRRTAYNIIYDSLKILRSELYKEEKSKMKINNPTFLMLVIISMIS